MIETKNTIKRIVQWNKERLLDKQKFDIEVEMKNIVEELLEMVNANIDSDLAREKAQNIVDEIIYDFGGLNDKANKVDALCDIIVYAVGALLKLGVDPECAMNETLKEIESRTGKIIDGKFVKDKSPEAQARWYKAEYKKCYK